MKFKQSLIRAALLTALILAGTLPIAQVQAQEITLGGSDKSTFNTLDLIKNTGEGLIECSHYCIVGVQVRFIYIPPPVNYFKIFYTPIVRHNTPDLIIMSGPSTDKQAWDDYSKIFGKIAKKIGDKMILMRWKVPAPVDGGPAQYSNFGQHQALVFKDADVLGNVMAYLVENLDAETGDKKHYKGNEGTSDNGDAQDKDRDAASENMLNDMSENTDTQMNDSTSDGFASGYYKMVVKNNPWVMQYTETVKMIVDAFKDSMPDMVVDYYGCNTAVTPFKPYYISNIDGILWRNGYPLTDPHKSLTILNPLAGDTIKPTDGGFSSDSLIAMIPGAGSWGSMFPRTGFVNNPDDYKVGAVTAARAMNIASEKGTYRIRQYAGGDDNDAIWQKIHPKKSSNCYYNIANSVSNEDNNTAQTYSWNGYRRYQCGLSTVGFHLADIIFGDDMICLGDGPSDKNSTPSFNAP